MKKIISGKVREVYDLENGQLVIVTTDRISAFDVILPTEIPDKGVVLNQMALFWFDYVKDIIPNHIISSDLKDMPEEFQKPEYEGRTILVKKLKMMNYEFIVRGYMFGSMWEAYKKGEEFCGTKFDKEYQLAQKLDEPMFTPSTKASEGHDIYVSFDQMASDIGYELAEKIRDISIKLYNKCFEYAKEHGIILVDTKFEFGMDENGVLTIADEIFTPDSSRFWDADEYKIGTSPKSFDKQFVRDWLKKMGIDGKEGVKPLPQDVVDNTSKIYWEGLNRLKGE